MRRHRAMQFNHPSLNSERRVPGFEISLTGGIAMIDEDASIRQSILMLLSTAPGERVMQLEYGCAINQLLFAPNDDTTAGLAMHYVREAIQRWEPRVEIVGLDAGSFSAEHPERLTIVLSYVVKDSQRRDRIEFDINLQGE